MIVVKNKKILLLGLGLHGGGLATARWLLKHGARLIVSDLKTKKQLAPSLKTLARYKNIKFVLGEHREQDIHWADIVVYNPGVPKESSFIKLAKKLGKPVVNEAGLFFDRCPCPIVAITGTRGKSTTAAYLAALLKTINPRTILAGNIRTTAMLEVLDKLTPKHLVVLELSSWQLEGLAVVKKSPHIAVVTNLYPDHLNRYRTLVAYYRAKQEIFRYQTKNDYLILNAKDPRLAIWSKLTKSRVVFFNNQGYRHGAENALAAVTAAKLLGVSEAAIKKVFKLPPQLTGRQEVIAKKRGLTFVNDTTATSPEAGIAALERFGSAKENIIFIAGGADKKLDYKQWAKAAKKYCRRIFLLTGDASVKMAKALGRFKGLQIGYTNLSKVLSVAVRAAKRGDIILFSPAAASFNLWQNEFERGDEFVKAVKKIK